MLFKCVRACVRTRVRACVRACVCVCVCDDTELLRYYSNACTPPTQNVYHPYITSAYRLHRICIPPTQNHCTDFQTYTSSIMPAQENAHSDSHRNTVLLCMNKARLICVSFALINGRQSDSRRSWSPWQCSGGQDVKAHVSEKTVFVMIIIKTLISSPPHLTPHPKTSSP